MNADMTYLVPIDQMKGEDEAETARLLASLAEARKYLAGFTWCRAIRSEFFGYGVGGIVSVFLVEIDSGPDVDRFLWVVVGDLPSAYLVTDAAPTPSAALKVYCDLMDDWIEAVRKGDVSQAFPVAAEPTRENADLLTKRVKLLREKVIPSLG